MIQQNRSILKDVYLCIFLYFFKVPPPGFSRNLSICEWASFKPLPSGVRLEILDGNLVDRLSDELNGTGEVYILLRSMFFSAELNVENNIFREHTLPKTD